MGTSHFPQGTEVPAQHHRHKVLKRVLIVLVVLAFLAAIVAGSAVLYLRELRDRLTDDKPQELAVVELDRDEQRKVEKKFEHLVLSCERGRSTRTEFSERELNGLIGALKDCRSLRGRVEVRIAKQKCWVTASIPLNDTGIRWLDGRYVNGEFQIHVQRGERGLEMSIVGAIVKNGSVPLWIMKHITKIDLLEDAYRDPNWGPRLRQIESVQFDLDSMQVQTKGEKN